MMKYLDDRLKESKIYNSVYKDNVLCVWNMLLGYPKRCRELFLENIKNIDYDRVSSDELYRLTKDGYVNGLYMPDDNKIFFAELGNNDTEIHHELFHVASCNRNHWGIIGELHYGDRKREIGECLNEGITEYLAISSTGINDVDSFYQLDVFVIEMLVHIYGKKILYPYFMGDAVSFYHQFGDDLYQIVRLDMLLRKIEKNILKRNLFDEYLSLREISSDVLDNNGLYLKGIKCDDYNMKALYKWLKIHEDEFDSLMENMDVDTVEMRNEGNIILYDYFHGKYQSNQKELFDSIIKILIRLARGSKYKDYDIKNMLISSLESKNVGIDMMEYQNKKLIKRK